MAIPIEERVATLEAAYQHLATKADIARLEGRIATVEANLQGRLKSLEASLQGQLGGLEASLQGQINGLEANLQGQINGLQGQIDGLEGTMLTAIAVATVILAGVQVGLRFWRPQGVES